MEEYYKICGDCKSFKRFAIQPRLSNVCGVCGRNNNLDGYEVEE